jgi:hypothetical protein
VSEDLTSDQAALRAFFGRILGWSAERARAIEHALHSIDLGVTHRATLVLLGETDMVPIALALHRRTLGAGRPFIVSGSRRVDMPATAHAPAGYASGVAAVQAARGGSLCLRHRRLPRDFERMVALVRDPDADVMVIVCSEVFRTMHPFLIRPVPIRVPALSMRERELPRIVDEYAADAIRALGASRADFGNGDRRWVIDHSARTLAEIETATLRLVAFRQAGGVVVRAAAQLGLSHVALAGWLARRRRWHASRSGQ